MKVTCLLLLALIIICNVINAKISLKKFKIQLNDYLENGTTSKEFEDSIKFLSLKHSLKGSDPVVEFKFLDGVVEYIRKKVTCAMCNMAANIAIHWVNTGESKESIVDKIVGLCAAFNIQKKHVCKGAAEAHLDVLMWIIKTRQKKRDPVTATELCALALYPDCEFPEEKYEWKMDLEFLGPKPPVIEPHLPPDGTNVMMVLQLTDFHMNPRYEPGSSAKCGEPTCCRAGQEKPPSNDGEKAGYWGDYRDCDTPYHAMIEVIQNAKKQFPDTAYVMFTGDVIDHVMWETTVDKNRESFSNVMNEVRQAFPDVPLLPILGNHESHPLNVFTFERGETPVPEHISTNWLYEEAAKSWGAFLPEDQKETILKGGYYAHEVRPGLLIVALNNNFCYNFNWWLMYDNFDPADQLKWLAETLLKAEGVNQKVHILSHIPMNCGECLSTWRREFQRIIHRFENTVVAQFHGHMHVDTFNVYYDPEDTNRPTNVAFIGGSATAYQGVNPNYRVYVVDGDREGSSYRILDHETWFFNLTGANLAGPDVPPVWQKLYSFKEAYGLQSMLPTELDKLVYKMVNDTDLKDDYFKRSVAYADSVLAQGCDKKCQRALICDIVSYDNFNMSKCNELIGPPDDIIIKDASNDIETLLAEIDQELGNDHNLRQATSLDFNTIDDNMKMDLIAQDKHVKSENTESSQSEETTEVSIEINTEEMSSSENTEVQSSIPTELATEKIIPEEPKEPIPEEIPSEESTEQTPDIPFIEPTPELISIQEDEITQEVSVETNEGMAEEVTVEMSPEKSTTVAME